MFENISKGKYSIDDDDVYENKHGVTVIPLRYDGKNRACVINILRVYEPDGDTTNAKFISFCFNLQQRLDIGCYEEVIKGLELSLNLFIEIGCTEESEIVRELSQILNKAKKL